MSPLRAVYGSPNQPIMEEKTTPILMTKEYWTNTQLSIVRYTGQIKVFEKDYIVVDKLGRTLFETSIPEGEPADLLQKDYLKFYKTLGRVKFVKILEDNPRLPDPKVKALMKEAVDAIKHLKSKIQLPEEPDIFKDAY